MTTTTKQRITTAEELMDMPDDGYRYELVRGELRKMAPAGSEHGEIASDIECQFESLCQGKWIR